MERIKIEELKTKYEFEPTLRDIFVEGDSDVCLINLFLSGTQDIETKVFPIECVEIPKEYLIENKLENNNRGRVIALSQLLKESEHCNENNILTIVDRDLDTIRKKDFESSILKYTDFTCMEMYAFNKEALDKFVKLTYSSFPINSLEVLNNVGDILQEVFLGRVANAHLGWNMSSYDFLNLCEIKADKTILFNKEEYINRYLNKNRKIVNREEFINSIEKYRKLIDTDIRYQIHGHDFINIFIWYIEKIKNKKCGYDETSIWKTLFLCSIDILSEYKLFEYIKGISS